MNDEFYITVGADMNTTTVVLRSPSVTIRLPPQEALLVATLLQEVATFLSEPKETEE